MSKCIFILVYIYNIYTYFFFLRTRLVLARCWHGCDPVVAQFQDLVSG